MATKTAKCSLCREGGHNRTTCPKSPERQDAEALPQLPPDELMRLLIPSTQALDLLVASTAAEALANATRQIGGMRRDGLGHLACSDILVALAELELRTRQLGQAPVHRIQHTADAVEVARIALDQAERTRARAKTDALISLGYQQAEAS